MFNTVLACVRALIPWKRGEHFQCMKYTLICKHCIVNDNEDYIPNAARMLIAFSDIIIRYHRNGHSLNREQH